jgi:3-hydroxyisobutyrate dehydrogenase
MPGEDEVMRIGIAGIGKMGKAIAERLKECGHEVTVWNRSPDKSKLLAEAGFAIAATARELAGSVDTVITILTDAEAINAVMNGNDGLLSGDVAGKLFIEMSTVRPDDQVRFANDVRSKGGSYVECAVGGTVGPAKQGKLIGLAGAEPADFEKAKPILEQLCRRIELIGPVGSGASMKLAVNLPLAVYYQTLGEAYALCRHLGKDEEWFIELLSDTSGGPNILKARGPTIAAALKGVDPTPAAFDVDTVRKDLRLMIAEAQLRGYALPVVERVVAVYDEASSAGWGNRDGNALPRYWTTRSG